MGQYHSEQDILRRCFVNVEGKLKGNFNSAQDYFNAVYDESKDCLRIGGDGFHGGGSGDSTNGSVFITDVTPTNDGFVTNKTMSSNGNILNSCITTTNLVDVDVIAFLGNTSYTPTIKINTNIVSLTETSDKGFFAGTISLDLQNVTELTVTHEDGAEHKITIGYNVAPIINSVSFSGGYPGTQTELKENDNHSISISADSNFNKIEIKNYGACKSKSFNVSESSNNTINSVIANKTPNTYNAELRVRTAGGVWSDWKTTSNTVKLNSTYPQINISSITYPGSQQALKNSETATIVNNITDYDTVTYSSSSDLLFSNQNTFEGSKIITRQNGDYVNSGTNITIEATRLANNAITSITALIKIANTATTADITSPARLRSGGSLGSSAQNHPIYINTNQEVVSVSMNAPVGIWQGNWNSSGNTWDRNLRITDNIVKGDYNFDTINIVNLAGVVTNVANNTTYTIGGFVKRTMVIAAWGNRQADIGTNVVDTSKLVCFNLGKNLTSSYKSTIDDELNKFTITNDNIWYNCDMPNAMSNNSGTMQVEIEETA